MTWVSCWLFVFHALAALENKRAGGLLLLLRSPLLRPSRPHPRRHQDYPGVLDKFPSPYKVGALLGEASGKVHVLDGLIQAMQKVQHPSGLKDKIVVVSNYTQTLDVLASLCKVRRWGYFQLDGSTPIKKRQVRQCCFSSMARPSQQLQFLGPADGAPQIGYVVRVWGR